MRGLQDPHRDRIDDRWRARPAGDDRRRRRPRAAAEEPDRDVGRDRSDAASRARVRQGRRAHDVTAAILEEAPALATVAAAAVHPRLRESVRGRRRAARPVGDVRGPLQRKASAARPAPASSRAGRRRRPKSCPARVGFVARSRTAPIAGRSRRRARRPLTLLHSRSDARRLRQRGHRVRAAPDPGEPVVRVPPGARAGRRRAPAAPYRVADVELASRLSFFLWSSIPDDELLRPGRPAARLTQPDVLAQQVRRMLADQRRRRPRRATSPGSGCSSRNLDGIVPNSESFPDFDDNLRQAFRREAELFFDEHHAGGPQRPRSADAPTTRS